MQRWLYFIAIAILMIPLIAAGLLGLAATQTGTRWIAHTAVHFVPGELDIGKTRGTLLRHLELDQIRYRLPPYAIDLGHLSLTWHPKDLFSKRLTIEKIVATGLRYRGETEAAPETEEPSPLILPGVRLPVAVVIHRAELNDAVIVQGGMHQTIEQIRLAAELTEDRLVLQSLEARAQPWTLIASGKGRLQGDYPLTLNLDWRAKIEENILSGKGTVTGNLRELAVDHRLTAPFQVVTRGKANVLEPELPFAIHGDWKNLAWPPDAPDYQSPQGDYRAEGTLSDYRIELNALVTGNTIPELQLRLQGRGNTESLTLKSLEALPPEGQLTATGKVSWAPTLAWELSLEGRDLNPQSFVPEWPGDLQLQASSSGNLDAYQLQLDARYAGTTISSLQLHLNGQGNAESLALKSLELLPPQGRLTATGEIGWSPALSWDLTLEGQDLNPQPFAPDWPGHLALAASSNGKWNKKRLFTLQIDHLRGSLRQQPVDAAGVVEFQNGKWRFDQFNVKSGANQLQITGSYQETLDLNFAFDGPRLHDLWPDLGGSLTAQGQVTGKPELPNIRAEARGRDLVWQAYRLKSLQMSLRFDPDDPASQGDFRLRQLQLPDQRIERLDLAARGGFDQHRWNLELETPQGKLATALSGSYRDGIWQARIDDGVRLTSSEGRRIDLLPLKASTAGDGMFEADWRLNFNARPLGLDSRLQLEIPDLAKLAPWLPQVAEPEGQISANLHVDGPISNLKPQGRLRLTGAAATIPPAGIRLTAIETTIRGDEKRLHLKGSLQSGEGRADFSGWAQLPGKLHLTLRGQDLQVARRTQVKVSASPDLVFDLSDQTARLEGTVTIPDADIQLKELPKGSVTISEDEIIVGADSQTAPPPFQLTSRVEVILGKSVRLEGFGLKTGLTGRMEVRSRNAQTSAYGAIDLEEGTYKAYGQNLTIEKGRLIFNGPVDQPYLDLKAVRTIPDEDVIAILEVRGPAQNPILKVRSQPPLPETEALAYLLTGRSFKSSGQSEQAMIAKAALSMGIDLAIPWIKQLGLDEVEMRSGATLEETSLALGKYLTPDLYVGYAFSLFNGIGKALLRYRINRFFTVEAGAGTSQSIDLFYTLESD
ncbi:MAG: translocation/assembly module TamB domain-containing protein [Methylohalobius crimeensis]